MTPQAPASSSNGRSSEALLLRAFRLMLAYLWALALALTGVWVWVHANELAQMLPAGQQAAVVAIAALCLAGAQFIFMLLVADDLCPKASTTCIVFLKTFTGSVVWMSLIWLCLLAWRWLH